jgi:hypothetical protein
MEFQFDSDGYPTDKTLREVRRYSGPALDFFHSLKAGWWHGETGVRESSNARDRFGRRIVRFRLHTWGWSGNESLIEAMEKNLMLHLIAWQETRRGGHYIYQFYRRTEIPSMKKRLA